MNCNVCTLLLIEIIANLRIMATEGLGSGPVSLFGVSNKLQSKMNSFREVIERKKLEVRRVSEEMKNLIEKKEEEIIRELDIIWEEMSTRMKWKKTKTQAGIEEAKTTAEKLEKILRTLNPMLETKIDILLPVETAKREMDIDIPNVKLTWRVDELKDCINRMCRCEQHILVYNEDTRFRLKWSRCEEGRGDTQLNLPWGVATNSMNENVFVADQWNDRVQIFSREGEWIRSVKDDEMKHPLNILFHNQSIYVLCSKAILKLNESTEEKEKSKSYDFNLAGICTDDINIYVGKWNGMNLIVLTLDLIEEKRISLKTEFCKQDTQISDVSLSQELFYILLLNTEFPIQAFSREGILRRCVVKKDNINRAYCFCLDQQHNILVADCGDSKVRIFSNEGKLLTQFGEKGSGKGQFFNLSGISFLQHDSIITTECGKTLDKLQLFSTNN